MPMFDTYLMMDWSAGKPADSDRPKSNAIWWAVQRGRSAHAWTNPPAQVRSTSTAPSPTIVRWPNRIDSLVAFERTRSSAIKHVLAFLENEVAGNRRVLLGLDFAFGYPKGFAKRILDKPLTGTISGLLRSEFQIGDLEHSHDDEEASKQRFRVARTLNERLGLKGPFWSVNDGEVCEKKGDPYPKGRRESEDRWPNDTFQFERLRVTDKRAPGAQSVWKVSGPGSVGSQALLGLPWLEVLHEKLQTKRNCDGKPCRSVIWPRTPEVPRHRQGPLVVIVEIYPSLITRGIGDTIPDRAQVMENARAFELLDARGQLEDLFDLNSILGPSVTETERDAVTSEEGWILGTGCDRILQSVAKEDSVLFRKRIENRKTG